MAYNAVWSSLFFFIFIKLFKLKFTKLISWPIKTLLFIVWKIYSISSKCGRNWIENQVIWMIYKSLYLCIYVCIYVSTYHLSVSVCLSISTYLPTFPPTYLPIQSIACMALSKILIFHVHYLFLICNWRNILRKFNECSQIVLAAPGLQ
jgi:hypothetical protein